MRDRCTHKGGHCYECLIEQPNASSSKLMPHRADEQTTPDRAVQPIPVDNPKAADGLDMHWTTCRATARLPESVPRGTILIALATSIGCAYHTPSVWQEPPMSCMCVLPVLWTASRSTMKQVDGCYCRGISNGSEQWGGLLTTKYLYSETKLYSDTSVLLGYDTRLLLTPGIDY